MTASTTPTTDLERFVYDTLETFGAERAAMTPEATLESLDVDSLDLVELAQLVEERYGAKLETRDFEGVETLGDALAAIARKVS
ncbi:MAG TPA: phosphopantetheine-binding protein [Solirubrobacteraceae bacterium]|nr:phosphopantetheine-binding protein [Solirubrobacteraceae bacterium]